ncbi:hypothetical protein [Paraburkholderia phenoliruptrix]|uniref:hypothetical protein n=1 Tax=Paraburkholderia phenoliruptrix TaxID=252970 RepID=UPI001C6F0D77|nr:hypothetical protein [Paraburkholderia phenoliruptrix]MBW9106217.1 hypothetical protein [Paraburkholderia phenoliruptrix]MBW9129290.1 hypothetical protein [Paraburkholderia ginsengiterrae]
MKTLFAALASALLVSTAFAQTAAPAPSQSSQSAQAQPAGQANLKASTDVQTGASDQSAATAKAPAKTTDKATAKPHVKTSSKHVAKKHKAVKKTSTDSSAAKAKTDDAQETSNAPMNPDGAKTGTTKTQ